MWHTEDILEEEKVLAKEEATSEEKTEDSPKGSEVVPDYKDYKSMDEIPEKDRKHYGI